jgi:16S rRNA (guanine527-N7)-methyltransferase
MDSLARSAKTLFNITLTPAQLEMFRRYADELTAWNQHTNLTAITDPEAIENRHFLDSLSCLLVMKPRKPGIKVIDVGTGAGFPGLPLKIAFPELNLTLVEATGKKIDFLEHMIGALGLKNVALVNERVETVAQLPEHREGYDWVLARAVAGMRTLAEYLLPLAKIGGHMLAQKGESGPQEVSDAQEPIKLLGGHIVQLTAVELPTVADTHYLIDIQKVAATPPQYPRRVGVPSKKPL